MKARQSQLQRTLVLILIPNVVQGKPFEFQFGADMALRFKHWFPTLNPITQSSKCHVHGSLLLWQLPDLLIDPAIRETAAGKPQARQHVQEKGRPRDSISQIAYQEGDIPSKYSCTKPLPRHKHNVARIFTSARTSLLLRCIHRLAILANHTGASGMSLCGVRVYGTMGLSHGLGGLLGNHG